MNNSQAGQEVLLDERPMRDHLVEPSPGRGWIFTDVGAEALAHGCRFRL